MKALYMLLPLSVWCGNSFAQQDSTSAKKNEDTLYIGKMIIVRKGTPLKQQKEQRAAPARKNKASGTSTNWLVLDLGVNLFRDATNYNDPSIQDPLTGFAPGASKEWFDLQNNKNVNVNIWFFIQRVNMIKKVVNLQYGLGVECNNYRFTHPVLFSKNPTRVLYDASTSYRKNKLGTNYLTLPMMVHFNFTPKKTKKGYGVSAGLSLGYLYNSRQKTITADKVKSKTRDNFELRPWKVAYTGELSLGAIKLYASFADKSMFRKGLDFIPYNVGLRLNSW